MERGLLGANALEGDVLAGPAVLKEIADIVFHIVHVDLAVVVKLLEMGLVAVQEVGYLLPIVAVDGLVGIGQLQQKLVQLFPRSVAATGNRQG